MAFPATPSICMRMAKLAVSAQVVNSITHYICSDSYGFCSDHHSLDHSQLKSSSKPQPRPYLEKLITGNHNLWRDEYDEKVTWPEGALLQSHRSWPLGHGFNSPTSLKKLKTLSIKGHLATDKLFERLPKSLVKLSWEWCNLPASALLKALSSSGDNKGSFLPNLKCFSVWDKEEIKAAGRALRMQGGCFPNHNDYSYGLPTLTDEY
ncbi:hypothetical protein PCANC_16362 [Puccinia coronata f. sp. avenae]|uniref:Uncharacterized protein n=1 Tax=Puccinia coronata f. sp. avenae TaxID=200324 RepID=A0A2N5UQQ8_9BASI|nr:hypothetical protein PCANC_16362 [Puccinia coronata f. sp. avenae]